MENHVYILKYPVTILPFWPPLSAYSFHSFTLEAVKLLPVAVSALSYKTTVTRNSQLILHVMLFVDKDLTFSPPIPSRLYTLPYWSNPPFLIFDIRALWRSVLSARAPECQKLKMVGYTTMAWNPSNSRNLEQLALKRLTGATSVGSYRCRLIYQANCETIDHWTRLTNLSDVTALKHAIVSQCDVGFIWCNCATGTVASSTSLWTPSLSLYEEVCGQRSDLIADCIIHSNCSICVQSANVVRRWLRIQISFFIPRVLYVGSGFLLSFSDVFRGQSMLNGYSVIHF